MEDNFNLVLDKILREMTPEKLIKIAKKEYEEDRDYLENFSKWYNHIIDFGYFKHSNIIANQIFTLEEVEIMQEENIDKVKWDKINQILKPTLDKMENNKIYNIKNGCFSNKFDFRTCLATKANLANQLWEINNVSSLFETGGYTELVVREFIPYDYKETPTIYNGMPLREEIRVFYNMDKKEIEYMVDYWNYEYCYENINNKTDKIIFDWFHNKIGERKIQHQKKVQELFEEIKQNIDTLKFDNKLKGIWSIDFLFNDGNNIYLIDMARGCRSSYWDKNKIGK